jgi:hypothetical protein
MKTMMTAAAFSAALLAFGAAQAQSQDATTTQSPITLEGKLHALSLRSGEDLSRLVLASAETRLRSKIDNLEFRKPNPQTLPAFTVASAFTD